MQNNSIKIIQSKNFPKILKLMKNKIQEYFYLLILIDELFNLNLHFKQIGYKKNQMECLNLSISYFTDLSKINSQHSKNEIKTNITKT